MEGRNRARTGGDFLKACANLNDVMAERARIDGSSRVLDIGCGNGNTAFWMANSFRCHVTGIDLSGVPVGNAITGVWDQPAAIRDLISFKWGSATELPFNDGHFTHVWSQATFYHVHDNHAALMEAYRVLGDGGTLVFDDLFKPKREISQSARQYVYDRLLFDTDFSFESYQDSLRSCGFQMLGAQDLSGHLKTSYACLAKVARIKRVLRLTKTTSTGTSSRFSPLPTKKQCGRWTTASSAGASTCARNE